MSGRLAYELAVVRVFVFDWDAAVAFYAETLGMPLRQKAEEPAWAAAWISSRRQPANPGAAPSRTSAIRRETSSPCSMMRPRCRCGTAERGSRCSTA